MAVFDSLKKEEVNEANVKNLISLARKKLYTDFELTELVINHILSITDDSLRVHHANAYKIKGVLYDNKGRLNESLEFYLKAIEVFNEIDKKAQAARCQANIGLLYLNSMGEPLKAREYFSESREILLAENDTTAIPTSSVMIGISYFDVNNHEEALKWFIQAKNESQKYTPKMDLTNIRMNIANCHLMLGNYEDVLESYQLLINKSIQKGQKATQRVFLYNNLLGAYGELDMKHEKDSLFNAVYREIKDTIIFNRDFEKFYKIYALNLNERGFNDKAFNMLSAHLKIKDSLQTLRKEEQFSELSTKYETEKKELEIENLNALNKLEEKKRVAEEEKVFYLQIGGGVLLLLIIFIVNSFRQKVKDNKKITLQKQQLSIKNKEILDSINYAKRLQDAILPPTKLVSSYLLDSFILYKPKDIVAGDFYFMDIVEEKGKKLVYYVAADCTGHGVPGAMVSIVGANGLKRCIQEFNLRKPGEILDKLTQLVAENFSQSEEKIRDGMDLAICCLEMENEKATKVHYAGANNPLWVINSDRKNLPSSAKEFKEGGGFEIKANKQAIGYTENISPFTTHTFEVEEGDTLFTFSDGYPDQFGGENGKKYKSANFRRFLLSIQDKNMDEQKKLVNEEFESWKGSLEQIDDVCVICVRL